MNNVRLRARSARINLERKQDSGWDIFLHGRKWAHHKINELHPGHGSDPPTDMEGGMGRDDTTSDGRQDQAAVPGIQSFSLLNVEVLEATEDARRRTGRPQILGKPLQTKSDIGEDKKPKQKYTFINQLVAVFSSSWLLLLIPFVPAGIASNYTDLPAIVNFIFNFLAIFPLASIVGLAMDEVMLRVGNFIGVLIYMTFGNVVQLVTSILLLKSRQIEILKTSLLGGILCGVLLIMGASVFAGGLSRHEQHFNANSASFIASFLTLSVTSLIIPTASHIFANTTAQKIASQSRGSSIVLLLAYAFYLLFQLKTHVNIFTPVVTSKCTEVASVPQDSSPISPSIAPSTRDEEDEEPQLSIWTGVITLVLGTALLAFSTEFAVNSIDGLTAKHASPTFVGLILLPILSNDLMPISCALMDKLDLSIMASAGKSLQTSLLITPLIVVIAWIWGIEDMGLLFDGFQVVSLFMAVLLFNFLISDGKSNYVEGVLLLAIYVMVAIAAWYN